jgi:hypothetical protein
VGLVAGLYHPLNPACFKGLLFLGSGAVLHATHTRNMEEMGGLIRGCPHGLLLLSSAPPRSPGCRRSAGSSRWLVFQALLGGPQLPQPELGLIMRNRRRNARADERTGRRLLRELSGSRSSRYPRASRSRGPASAPQHAGGDGRARSPASCSGSDPRSSCRC